MIEIPILDQDSIRYIPRGIENIPSWRWGPIPIHGSVIPQFINILPAKYFGYQGIAFLNIVLNSYAFAHLFLSIKNHLEPRRVSLFLIAYCLSILLLSFMPFVTLSIVSEPASMACLALIFSILLINRINLIDMLILFIFSTYHTSNLPIFLASLITIFFLRFIQLRKVSKVPLQIIFLLLLSHFLDLTLYTRHANGQTRMQASFIGGIILNYYPLVLDKACQEKPELRLCAKEVSEFITQNRTPEIYQPGRFLWGSSRIFTHLKKIPPKDQGTYLMTMDEFESNSKYLVRTALSLIWSHWPEYIKISLPRIIALFNQNKISIVHLPSNSSSTNEYSNIAYPLSQNESFFRLSTFIKLLQLFGVPILLAISFLLNLKKKSKPIRSELILIPLVFYIINLFFMGIIGTAVSRYHYRAFFLLTIVCFVLLWSIIDCRFTKKLSE